MYTEKPEKSVQKYSVVLYSHLTTSWRYHVPVLAFVSAVYAKCTVYVKGYVCWFFCISLKIFDFCVAAPVTLTRRLLRQVIVPGLLLQVTYAGFLLCESCFNQRSDVTLSCYNKRYERVRLPHLNPALVRTGHNFNSELNASVTVINLVRLLSYQLEGFFQHSIKPLCYLWFSYCDVTAREASLPAGRPPWCVRRLPVWRTDRM